MATVKVRDRQLREAVEGLGNAQAQGDATAADNHGQAVAARSRELRREDAASAKQQIQWVNSIAGIAGAIAVGILLWRIKLPWEADKHTRQAWGWAAIVMYLVYTLLGVIHWGDGGLLSYIRGKDGRLSTSLLQVGLWTVAVSTALVYFIFLAFYSSDPAATFKASLGGDNLPEEYLLLLGGPFAAAVIARLTVGAKVADEEVQKVEANAKLIDVVSDDDERASLVDAQFLVFNLVALTWFVGALIDAPTALPDIPDLLVGLTSTSAIAYTAAKGVAKNRPIVTSVTRYMETPGSDAEAIRPGDFVEIRGMNFVPAGAASEDLLERIVVKFGEAQTSPRFMLGENGRVRSPSDDWIVAQVPHGVASGNVRVSVVTAAGIAADARDMTVVEDKPVITGLNPPASAPGVVIDIFGRLFNRPGATGLELPSVKFGAAVVQADSVNDTGLRVTVPAHLAEGTVDVSVRAPGGTAWSDPAPLTILAMT
jgi:hypothetical protein